MARENLLKRREDIKDEWMNNRNIISSSKSIEEMSIYDFIVEKNVEIIQYLANKLVELVII